jgi:hypothetical protein
MSQSDGTVSVNINGQFYSNFLKADGKYSDETLNCIQRVVERLLSTDTSAQRPGMLLGKIQSGKTKTFLATIALAFDNGFDVALVLTKGTKALARQTLSRVRSEFDLFHRNDQVQIFDIMTVPPTLTGYELSQKIIIVVKKQTDNLNRLTRVFHETYPQLAARRTLIIDDEADYASVGFKSSRQEGLIVNRTTHQIDHLREVLPQSSFLQVTATPYSLYLQPDDFVVNGIEFRPIRPAFTELVPINSGYIGSDYYFDASLEHNTAASYIYYPLALNELQILRMEDRRRFRVEECLTSNAISGLRSAIMNFIVGGAIRHLQDQRNKQPLKKFSFLIHTEAGRNAHRWQEQIVTRINEELRKIVDNEPALLHKLVLDSYLNISKSIQVMEHHLPSMDDVLIHVSQVLRQGWLMITKVNSERQVEELLDDEGQLRLRTPLNIFIGGQILDRGITLSNLIGFFYGRRPQIYQQDTVFQHSRMFGFRPIEDLAVTRFYTEPAIYTAMRRMHDSDIALRASIERGDDQTVIFVQRDPNGRVIPCNPNKILISNTTTLRSFTRILPVGFQTDIKTRVGPITNYIDNLVKNMMSDPIDQPFKISLDVALDILNKIEVTMIMQEDMGYSFDWEACRAALRYMSAEAKRSAGEDFIWCLFRENRNLSRFQPAAPSQFSDAPDTSQREGAIARRVAINAPILMLIRQNGLEAQDWRGAPFYWPIIQAPQNIRTSIFAHATAP